MVHKHEPQEHFEGIEGHTFEYRVCGLEITNTYKAAGYAGFGEDIFYLSFEDCRSKEDDEGFLLMCSEEELVQLINHLRMIRGV